MSSGFITEAEIEEKRKIRQQQWEQVRKPEDPKDVPEVPIDNRSLYEILKEQKDRKQEEFEEAHKLKNLVKTLDDDEIQFLDYVDQARLEEDKRKRLEEAKELSEFRNAVSNFRAKELEKVIHHEISSVDLKRSNDSKKPSQSQRLVGLVKRKSNPSQQDPPNSPCKKLKSETDDKKQINESDQRNSYKANTSTSTVIPSIPDKGSLVCIGILPGLANYDDSSDEDGSSLDNDLSNNSTDPRKTANRDLCGRVLECVEDKKKSH